jgi:hypothetical protein
MAEEQEGSLLGSSLTDSWIGLPTASSLRDRVRSLVTDGDEAAEPPAPSSSPSPALRSPEAEDDPGEGQRSGGAGGASEAAEKAAEEAAWRAATAATVAAEAEDAAALALEAVTQAERDARVAEQRAGSVVDASLGLQVDAAAAPSARLVEWLQTQRHANAILLAVDCLAHKEADELASLGIDHETATLLREARAMVTGSGTETLSRPTTPLVDRTAGEARDDVPVVVAVPVEERDEHRDRYTKYMYIAGGVTFLLAALRALNRHRNPDPSWREAQRAMQEAQDATRRAAEAKQSAEQAQRSAKVGGASAAIGATVGTMIGGPVGTVIGGVVGGAIGGLY